MVLGYKVLEFLSLSNGQLKEAIIERRKSIREHRDAKGDDRCFLDDYDVWRWLSDTPPMPHFSSEVGMQQCALFWKFRNTGRQFPNPKTAIMDPNEWDRDLLNPNLRFRQLAEKLRAIQLAIESHRDVYARPRNYNDDRRLYRILPEKILADFRLPSKAEFLGEAKAPTAGCPSFWRSHAGCDFQSCNLHVWGPCTKHKERA